MPIVPQPQKVAARIRQIPQIGTPRLISGEDLGAGVWREAGRAARKTIGAVAAVTERDDRATELADARAAEDALNKYTAWADETLYGAGGEDGSAATPGITARTGASATGVAADWAAQERQWMDSPDSPYAGLSAPAREIFERQVAGRAQRNRSAIVQHELQQADAQRAADAQARVMVAERALGRMLPAADDDFSVAATDYAEAQADQALRGQFLLEPDGGRTFSSKETETAWRAAHDAATSQARGRRGLYLAQRAAQAELDDPAADDDLKAARSEAKHKSIAPDDAERVAQAVAQAVAQRERAAAQAQSEENDAALATLDGLATLTAEPDGTEPHEVTLRRRLEAELGKTNGTTAATQRRNQAVKWALAEHKRKVAEEQDAAATVAERQRRHDSKFYTDIGMSGLLPTADGHIVPADPAERRAFARAELGSGKMTLEDYRRAVAAADADEAREDATERQAVAAELAQALDLQKDVRLIVGREGTKLAANTDPQQRIMRYSYKYRADDGTRVKEKRALLARDLPQIVDMLVAARRTDGQKYDLDGQPLTAHEAMDYPAYRQKLLQNLANRMARVDFDLAAANIFHQRDTATRREQMAGVQAMGAAAAYGRPTTKNNTQTNGDTDED